MRRLKWIDISKCLGMLLVIFGHYMQTLHIEYGGKFTDIFYWIYSFHMPLFFLLSGFVYKKYDVKTFLKKRVKSLIFPVILFSFLYTLYKIIIIHEKIDLIGVLTCRSESFIHLYWFLWALFWVEIFYFTLNKVLDSKIIILFLSICILTICCLFKFNKILLDVPLCIGNLFFLLVFFAIGVVLKEKKIYKFKECYIVFFFVAHIFLCFIYKSGPSYALLSFGNWIIDYCKAILGAFALLGIAQKLSNSRKSDIMQKIGMESVWIYLIHGFFFWGVFKKILKFIPKNNGYIIMYTCAFTIFTIVIIYGTILIYKKIVKRGKDFVL